MHSGSRLKALPASILSSREALGLDKEELHGLWTWINFVIDICDRIEIWIISSGVNEDRVSFLNALELHLGLALSLNSEPANSYSWWRAHSTWNFAGDPSLFLSRLPVGFAAYTEAQGPVMGSKIKVFQKWLDNSKNQLLSLIDSLSRSTEFGEALACIIAMNVVISKMLSGVSMQRLSRSFFE